MVPASVLSERKRLEAYLGTSTSGVERPGLYALRNTLAPHITPHSHDFFEIELILEGLGENRVGSVARPIGPGSVFLGNPLEEHEIVSRRTLSLLSIKFDPSLVPGVPHLLEPFLTRVPEFRCLLPPGPPEEDLLLRQHAQTIVTEYETRPRYWQDSAVAALLSLLVLIARRYDVYLHSTEGLPRPSPNPLVLEILAFFQERFREPLRMDELEGRLGYTRAHLNRVFHAVTGQSLKSYLVSRRIRHACLLLRTTAQPVTEVALASGFSDLSQFNRSFRQRTGLAPSVYRKSDRTPMPETS